MPSGKSLTLRVTSSHPIFGKRWAKRFHSAMPLVDQTLDVRTLQGVTSLAHLWRLLPNGNHVAISFDTEGVCLYPHGDKITINKNTVKPGESLCIPPMSGRHTLGIGNLTLIVQVQES